MSLFIALLAVAAASADPAVAPPIVEKPKKICKSITVTGSRLGRRKVCASKEEWDRQAREAERAAEEAIQPPLPPPGR